jgi:hydroxymethylpyrimidine pyrophosphatase-like HAD family hydrolase
MSDYYHIPLEQIATLGDQPNDVLMFKRSGLSIAMGNASEEVKQEATYVTASNEEEEGGRGVDPATGCRRPGGTLRQVGSGVQPKRDQPH